MSLLTVAQLRVLVTTDEDDTDLAAIIDREEAEIIRRYGAHYVDALTTITEQHQPQGQMRNLFLRRGITSVSSISERRSLSSTPATVASSDYFIWSDQGRIERISGTWGAAVTVVYVPADDSHLRRQAIVELVRLALEQTAMRSESVAGEYSYTAPDWEQVRAAQYRRLGFTGV